MTHDFALKCQTAQECIPQGVPFRDRLTALHNAMLAQIAELEAENERLRSDVTALLAGITDQRMVDNAERLVSSAIQLAATTGQTAESAFWYMLQAVNVISRNAVIMAAVGIVGVETNASTGTSPQVSEVPA